jgi:uncharacterized BrkB/YihY/UPF0761 family membrane protein
LLQIVSSAVSLGVITLLFAMMFKWLPDAEVAWRDVWAGATVTAVLFELGKFLIGLYIGKQGLESTFGAAASLVVLLIWVYYSSQIVLIGAEFTRAYAHRHASARVAAAIPVRAGLEDEAPPDIMHSFAKQSPIALMILSLIAGAAVAHPAVQRILGWRDHRQDLQG